MFSLKKVEGAPGCCHPLPHRVTEETQPLLTGPLGKDKRQQAEVTAAKILIRHMEKNPSVRVVQVWVRHQRGGEICVLGYSPD